MNAQERDDLLEERRQTMAKLQELEEKVWRNLTDVTTKKIDVEVMSIKQT